MSFKILMNAQSKHDESSFKWSKHLEQIIKIFCLGLALFSGLVIGILIVDLTSTEVSNLSVSKIKFVSVFLIGVAGGAYLLLQVRTIIISTHSLVREYTKGTWDLLLLTNLNAQKIVYAKWIAIIQQQIFGYILAAFFIVFVIVIQSFSTSSWQLQNVLINVQQLSSAQTIVSEITFPSFFPLFIGAILVGLLIIISLPLTAACGLFSGATGQSQSTTIVRGFVTRIVIHLFPFTFIFLVFGVFAPTLEIYRALSVSLPFITNTISAFATTLIDQGASALSSLAQIDYSFISSQASAQSFGIPIWSDQSLTFTTLVLVLIYNWIATWLLLYAAQMRLIKLGALSK